MISKIQTAALLATMLTVGPGAEAAELKKFSDQAELSYVETRGNTEAATLSCKNSLKVNFSEKTSATWKIAALNGQSDGVRNAENYRTELRGDYLLTTRWYAYFNGGWEKDAFSGLDSRFYIGPGSGYKLLAGPIHLLTAEAGLNYVSEEDTSSTGKDFLAGRLFSNYEFAVTATNRFSQSLEYLHNFEESDAYNIKAETALTSTLSSRYSMKVSYTVKYDHRPEPAALEHTDTTLTAALVADFQTTLFGNNRVLCFAWGDRPMNLDRVRRPSILLE